VIVRIFVVTVLFVPVLAVHVLFALILGIEVVFVVVVVVVIIQEEALSIASFFVIILVQYSYLSYPYSPYVSLSALLPYPPGSSLDPAASCHSDLVVEEPAPTKTGSHVTLRANVCKQRRQVLVTSSGNVLQVYVDSSAAGRKEAAPSVTVLLHFSG